MARNGNDRHQRVNHGGDFVQLPKAILRSPAWASLSMRARCLLLALFGRFNGRNNGEIAASARDLADAIGSRRYSANRAALGELIQAGFIVMERMHPRGSRMASEFRLTWIESGPPSHRAPATDEWRAFESGNKRKNSGDETSTRNRKRVDAPSTERKLRVDAPSTGEAETAPFRVDALSTHIVSHLSGRTVVPFPSSETLQNTGGPKSGASCGMDLAELRSFTRSYLAWAGAGAQSRLADSAGVPGGSLSKFLAGRGLAAQHRMNLQLAVGRAWPLEARRGAA